MIVICESCGAYTRAEKVEPGLIKYVCDHCEVGHLMPNYEAMVVSGAVNQ